MSCPSPERIAALRYARDMVTRYVLHGEPELRRRVAGIVGSNARPEKIYLLKWNEVGGAEASEPDSYAMVLRSKPPILVALGTLDENLRPNYVRIDYSLANSTKKVWEKLKLKDKERKALIEYARRWFPEPTGRVNGTVDFPATGMIRKSAVRRLLAIICRHD